MTKSVETAEQMVARLRRQVATPYKPSEEEVAKRKQRAIQLPAHPLALASANFNEVVRSNVFLAYHADRAARGATDPLALKVAEWIRSK